jgi:uncharacterized protein YkwD
VFLLNTKCRTKTAALVATFLLSVPLSGVVAESRSAHQLLIAVKKKAPPPRTPAKQIYELSQREETSDCLSASGVAAYVVSAAGSNRGLLLRNVERGFATSVGMQSGDVLLSVNSRVVQSGQDADRILQSSSTGRARIVFVHPSESGLQLYNTEVNLPKFSAASATPHIVLSTQTSPMSGQKNTVAESMPAYEKYMIELINHDRGLSGRAAIQSNAALTAMARAYASDLAARGFFGHVDPDGNDPQARAKSHGISHGVFENIAFQGGSESGYRQLQMMDNIMMSEPPNQVNHRSNILDPNHATVGVGVIRAANGRLYAVEEFSHESP